MEESLLAKQIRGGQRSRRGDSLSHLVQLLTPEECEFLFLNNSIINRAITVLANGIMTPHPEIETESEVVQKFLRKNRFFSKLYEFTRDGLIYGNSYWEIYTKGGEFRIAPLSPLEIDFQRDSLRRIIFEEDHPKGYTQSRRGREVAKFKFDEICHFQPIKLSGRETGISAIQHVMSLAINSNEVTDLVIEYLYRSLPLALVRIQNASERDIDEVENYLGAERINTRDHFCFSDRFEFKMDAPKGNRVEIKQHYELFLSLFAGAFSIPPSLLVPGLQGDKVAFSELMFEFYKSLEPIKTKLIETLEERLFEVAFPDEEIKIKFPNARVYSEKEYLNSIGFLTTNAIISPLQAQKILKRMGFIDEIEQGVPDYEEFKRQKLNFGGSE